MKSALRLAQWLSRQAAPAWSPREPLPLPWGAGTPPATLPPQAQGLYLRGWSFATPPAGAGAAQWCGPVDAAQPNCVAFGVGDSAVAGDSSGQVFLLRGDAQLDGWRGLRLGSHASAVAAVAVRADGKRAVSACHDGSLKVWRLDDDAGESLVQTFQLGDEIERIALSGDALHAVTATRQGGLQVWDLSDATGIATGAAWFDRRDAVHQLAMSGDGCALLAVRADESLQWFSGAVARTLQLPPGARLEHVAIAPDASYAVAVLNGNAVCVWRLGADGADMDTRVWPEFGSAPRIAAIRGGHCIVALVDGRLVLSSLGEGWGRQPLAVWSAGEGGVRDIAIDAARQRAWSASGDGVLWLWDLAEPTRGGLLTAWRGVPDWVRRVVVSADSSHAVAVAHDGTARLWSLAGEHQPPQAVWRAHERSVEAFALGPDAQRAVSGAGDGSLRLWSLAAGAPAQRLADWVGHSDPVDAIALGADGRRAVSASYDKNLCVWDLVDPARTEALAVWRGHEKSVHLVVLSADSTRAVSSAYDNTLRVWNLADPSAAEALAVWSGHGSLVTHVALSRDGQRAVSASYDSTLRVWNLGAPASSGEALAVWRGHDGVVRHVALADDGSRAVSAADDSTLRVWDFAATGSNSEALAVWRGHSGPVQQLAISSDSRRVVSVGDDRTLRVWDLADLARTEPLAVWHLLHRASAVCWSGARIVASGVDGWTVFDGADETARPRAWRAVSTTLLVAPATALRVSAAGLELAHEDALHTEFDAEGRLLPADPRIFGLLTFAAGEALFDAWQLAHRIDWPDEPQPRRFRVRWGSDTERQRWLPRLEHAPGGHDAG